MPTTDRSPNCGHSACSLNFIDTGDIECLLANPPMVNILTSLSTPTNKRADIHEIIAPGDELVFRDTDGRVISIKARNRNPLDDALSAVVAFACGVLFALLISTLLGSVQ